MFRSTKHENPLAWIGSQQEPDLREKAKKATESFRTLRFRARDRSDFKSFETLDYYISLLIYKTTDRATYRSLPIIVADYSSTFEPIDMLLSLLPGFLRPGWTGTTDPKLPCRVKILFEMKKDEGWAWCVCFGSFIGVFISGGIANCSGVILSALVDRFHITRAEAALVSGLVQTGLFLFSAVSTFCCKRCGARATVAMGTVLICASLTISSFASSIKILYFSYGIPMGLGCSLCYLTSFLMVSKYFKFKLSTANGIAQSGGSLGTLVLSPVTQQLFARLGMSNGLRVLGAISLLLLIPVYVYRPLETTPSCKTKSTKKWLNTSVLRNRYYLIWMAAMFLFQMNYVVPYLHLVRLAEDVGASKTAAALLISILAVCSFIGRCVSGRLADFAWCNRLIMCQLALLSIGVSTTFAIFAPSYGWMALYACVFGVSEGVYIMVVFIITQDIVGCDNIALGIGVMYSVLSIPKILGPVLVGYMFDATQSYTTSFMVIGGLSVTSCVLLFLIPYNKLITSNEQLTFRETRV